MKLVKVFMIMCGILWLSPGCENASKQQSLSGDKEEVNVSVLKSSEAGVAVFEKEIHNFGSIRQGEEVSVRFYFTNPGPLPLVIEKVKTGCGCTVANYPREPVSKDERKYIEVMFNSQGRNGLQYQEVSVRFANIQKSTLLTIVAQIREN